MADEGQEKTEEPTERKLDEARKRGEVATTAEMRHAVMFSAAFVATGGLGASLMASLMRLFADLWGGAGRLRLDTPGQAQASATALMAALLSSLWPLLLLLVLAPVLIWLLQGSPTIAAARLKPQWSKLSPLAGLGRMFGPRALVEFGKTLLKASAVGLIALMVIWPRMAGLDQLIGADPSAIGRLAGALIRELLKVMAMAVAALALFDFLYQRQAFLRRMRMSLQDIRDEMKQSDGDPAIKARIRAIRMARARQRMMAAVPKATVVITNPTHYAVALKYEHGVTAAPVVVAKGVDAVAIRIRERAKASDVAIVEAPPLARALHAAVKLDQPIPVEHYTAVAEIIGQIMRLARASAQAQS